jgi:type II secretory pathway pseudopilin PulG
VEILLVLAIIGIISGIAIPSYLGQRVRARVIGDASTNARVFQMALEGRKADTGTYGPAGTYDYKSDGTRPGVDLVPTFVPKGNSKMDYSLVVDASGLTYTINVTEAGSGKQYYQIDQTGAELFRYH